jgi:hypothetical protein
METVSSVTPSPSPMPFWPQTATDWAPVVTVAILLIALLIAARQLYQTVRTRHASMLEDLSRRWDEPLLVEARELAAKHGDQLREWIEYYWTPTVSPELFVLLRIPNFLEDLAVLEDRGAISFRIVKESFGGAIVFTWNSLEPANPILSKEEGYDPVYSNFERLAKRMRKALKKYGLP